MDLTFQGPMQYCSLQHQTLLPSPVTSTTGHCFHFGSISSFFLELFLHSSPVAYLALTNLGRSSFGVISLAFLYCSWGSQGKNTEVVCHSLLWIMASGPITSWEIDGETVETVSDSIFWGSKITADGDCSHEIKRRLLLGKKL